MAHKMDATQVALLRQFVKVVTAKPEMLNLPELGFFKEWMVKLGAIIPEPQTEPEPVSEPIPEPIPEPAKEEHMETSSPPRGPTRIPTKEPPKEEAAAPVADSSSEFEDSPESDLDLDMTGVVEADIVQNQDMGDHNKEVSEEDLEKAAELRSDAMSKASDGDIEGAVVTFTEAIKLNPNSALLYSKRASLFIKLSKPNAAIKDTTEAINLNPDSAQGYKWRGKAHAMLGHWAESAKDLQTALKLDYDEDANEWLKLIKSKSDRIREHNQKQERKSREKETYMRKKRVKRAKKQYEADKKAEEERMKSMPPGAGSYPSGMGGMGGMGGAPGAGGGMPPGMNDIFNDPELMELMQDKEVMDAFQEAATDPSKLSKYANNPRVMKAMQKMQEKLGGLGKGGMGAGPMGGMGAGPMGDMGAGPMSDDMPD